MKDFPAPVADSTPVSDSRIRALYAITDPAKLKRFQARLASA